MMCLASKIRLLCGKANSPTLSSRTFRFKELDAKRGGNNTTTDNFKVGTLFFEKENDHLNHINGQFWGARFSLRRMLKLF